ncbi:alcohol dehydrogenase [Chromobacterium alticapitis]|uniref:Alcohol dehydrogenase n=2 Tax=Chromobacterium alticapitis TaxID=2073169 RepID=A0A2S5DCG0_9NEIS|nr:alcohol dehydrogenase [Chromobacterium alticapitis]
MKDWESTIVGPHATLREAMETIDRTGIQAVLVVDTRRRLLGVLTDGDTRRGLLSGLGMSTEVKRVMHSTPTCVNVGDSPNSILGIMRSTGLHHLPIVDADRTVVGLAVINDYLATPHRDNWVVIMAGGLGSRLQELTRDVPKPMLNVGTRPLLETIIRSYADQGFHRFYLAVNYKAEQIEAHFGDGHALGVDIRYLREEQRMGTAGALSLLPERPTSPFIVTNADLLTKQNYGVMIDGHVESGAQATMAVRHYEMQVPFGVVRANDDIIECIEEKPVQHFVVNAGIYVLSPQTLDLVPRDQFFDMPNLLGSMLQANMMARTHQIDGYWLDIGRMPDYERANLEFHEVFQ